MNLDSKPTAPNFREVQACNNCKYSESYDGTPGGTYVECEKYSADDSVYNQYVCDGYKEMEET